MSLNKRNGLYAMPSHHVHGVEKGPRPVYSSLDFAGGDEDEAVEGNEVKKEKKDSTMSGSKGTPATTSPLKKKKTPKVKESQGTENKRKHTADHTTPPSRKPSGFVVGADLLHNVQSAVKAADGVFAAPPSKKKKGKQKSLRRSADTVDFDRMASETRSIDQQEKKKLRKERKRVMRERVKQRESATPGEVLQGQVLQGPGLVKRTPVPLPANAFSHAVNMMKGAGVGQKAAGVVEPATPQQVLEAPEELVDSPIPFSLAASLKKSSGSTLPQHRVSHKTKPQTKKNRVLLTTSNLLRYTQPLNDTAKPRPISRATSPTGSTASCGTTPSIKAMLEHVGKPYVAPGTTTSAQKEKDKQKNKHHESHTEASALDFTTRYHHLQSSINFTDELSYLAQHTTQRHAATAAGPLPCLGIKASGCSVKRERALLSTPRPTPPALDLATHRAHIAETLLTHAIHARIPIPLGRITGLWRLFCAPYSAVHVDKYALGQRTLSIFSLAGTLPSTPDPSYTARLSLPPRSMLYSTHPFVAPPHAGFRRTVLTVSEGYQMDVVFLGAGYLLLRVDVGLLLSGKGAGGRCMEMVGVREGAATWGEEGEGDEVEEVGRRLFAKYDGE